MKQIIVAGCGPAGMLAAISAAREGARVTILEGMEKPGKKLLLTGNGRCNLTNLDPELPKCYHSAEGEDLVPSLTQEIFQQFSVQNTLDFFHQLGLLTTDRNGYVYPRTGQSSSVLDLLLAELKRLKVKLKFSEKIEKLEPIISSETKKTVGWNVSTSSWTYSCDSLILCCGSKALPAVGSDGSGYALAQQLGHSISAVVPSLTALLGKGSFFSACAGVRCPAKVTLYTGSSADNKKTPIRWEKTACDFGELQWIEQGISGIVVFQISRFASLALAEGLKVKAELDLLPELSKEEILCFLQNACQQFSSSSLAETFSGLLPKKLLTVCLQQTNLKPGSPAGTLTEEQQTHLVHTMKHFSVPVTNVRSFDQCQVCAGGVNLREIHFRTLESVKFSNLYFAGELLDVDGPCGGYNLQWAWSSGYIAGKSAAQIKL